MQITYFWNQLHLRWRKITAALFFLFFCSASGYSQGMFGLMSTSGSEDQVISYGFFLAGHTSTFQIKYSNNFLSEIDPAAPTVQSITPDFTPGFALGFIGKLRLHDQLHLLLTPKIGFYEFRTQVNYFIPPRDVISPDSGSQPGVNTVLYTSEATMIELPLLLKYRSQRFNNTRMYFLGGGSYMFRTKAQDEANLEDLVTEGQDFSLELGMGFEIYFRYFKFAPEIRFSHGLMDIYREQNSNPLFADAISSVKRKSITIFLNFQ